MYEPYPEGAVPEAAVPGGEAGAEPVMAPIVLLEVLRGTVPRGAVPTALLFPTLAVTGLTTVDIGTELVTTTVELAGQSVTEAAQEVIVISCVLYMVDVVYEP